MYVQLCRFYVYTRSRICSGFQTSSQATRQSADFVCDFNGPSTQVFRQIEFLCKIIKNTIWHKIVFLALRFVCTYWKLLVLYNKPSLGYVKKIGSAFPETIGHIQIRFHFYMIPVGIRDRIEVPEITRTYRLSLESFIVHNIEEEEYITWLWMSAGGQ